MPCYMLGYDTKIFRVKEFFLEFCCFNSISHKLKTKHINAFLTEGSSAVNPY